MTDSGAVKLQSMLYSSVCVLSSEKEEESVNMTTEANGFGAHSTVAGLIRLIVSVCQDVEVADQSRLN